MSKTSGMNLSEAGTLLKMRSYLDLGSDFASSISELSSSLTGQGGAKTKKASPKQTPKKTSKQTKGTPLKEEVQYQLPMGDSLVDLNQFINKEIQIDFLGQIFCLDTGREIKKSYGQGYSYESFMKLAACDQCIVKPETCHYHQGTCREPMWGERHCMRPHVVYLANTSALKVGVTRLTQVPTRWIDQGASQAIILCIVPNRLAAGLLEIEIAKDVSDKTSWQKMLKETPENLDLAELRKEFLSKFEERIESLKGLVSDAPEVQIQFPLAEPPSKVKSVNFDKLDQVKGVLRGIKGQYLISDDWVFNVRRHQGYNVRFSAP